MKKLFATIIMLLMLTGCTGINTSVAVNVATDTAFVMVLQNNPTYKPIVVQLLTELKETLKGNITYDFFIIDISKRFAGKYAYVGVILTGYISADKPLFETYLPMLESYKVAIVAKLDRFILLAGSLG
jgi:hypothetical protein